MSTLKRTAILIVLISILLKVSGFIREGAVALKFGANATTDSYNLAFQFITLVLVMITAGFNQVFLPLYIKGRQKDPAKMDQNANAILNRAIILLTVLGISFYFLAPYLVPLMFPKINQVGIGLTQMFSLFFTILGVNGILDSYLQARNSYVPSQIAKLLGTLLSALCGLWFTSVWGIYSFGYGFILGTTLGTILQIIYMKKYRFHWLPTLELDPIFKKSFITLLIPSLLNAGVWQINVFVNKMFAQSTVEGAVTYLNNSQLISSIPQTIYGTTIAVIIFTMLTERAKQKDQFLSTLKNSIESTMLIFMPMAVGMAVVGLPLIQFIYERGKYTLDDSFNTYILLVLYSPLIVAQGLQELITKALYAQEKTKLIFQISLTTIIINIILNALFVHWFGYRGLAVATSLVALYTLVATAYFLYKDLDRKQFYQMGIIFLRSLPASIIMAGIILAIQKFTPLSSLYPLIQLIVLVPIGAVAYTVSTYIFYRDGFNQLLQLLKRKKVKQS